MSIRFLADADLNQAIVKGVRGREPALDIMSAAEAQLEGLSDLEVIAFAARQGRVLISHDTSTMPVLLPGICELSVAVPAFSWSGNAPRMGK